MKIDIPIDLLREIGYTANIEEDLEFEICELGDREPVSVTKSKYPLGILISIKEDNDITCRRTSYMCDCDEEEKKRDCKCK